MNSYVLTTTEVSCFISSTFIYLFLNYEQGFNISAINWSVLLYMILKFSYFRNAFYSIKNQHKTISQGRNQNLLLHSACIYRPVTIHFHFLHWYLLPLVMH